jgi:hypothetical protein
MKIGILTLPFNNNYGGYLQSYALLKVLKSQGHEVKLIMRRHNPPHRSFLFKLKFVVKGAIRSLITGNLHPLIYTSEEYFFFIGKQMWPFVKKYMNDQTAFVYNSDDLKRACKGKFDVYLVGSDQVWRPIYVPDVCNYFLDFTEEENVKRITYAASFGTSTPEFTPSAKEKCGRLFSNFDAVSVREISALDVIKSFGWVSKSKPVWVLDPTMLLCKDDYQELIKNFNQKSRWKYVFSYVLDQSNVVSQIEYELSALLDVSIIHNESSSKIISPKPSIEHWLWNIANADYVVTDSFHGMVFCILFNKPFLVYINKDRGAERFSSLLALLGLEQRIINNATEVNLKINFLIDWDNVNRQLERLRKSSFSYLISSLEK